MPVNPPGERPQRRNSLSSVDRSGEDEHERLRERLKEPEGQMKELESEVETLQLQVQEGHRGRERLMLEMERLRLDALVMEAESIIRKMEQLGDQHATEALSVATSSVSPNSSNTTDTTQLNPLSKDIRGSEVGVEGIHPRLSPPTIFVQPGSDNHQRQAPWSPSGVEHAGYSTYEYTHLHQALPGHVSPGWAPYVYLGAVGQSQYPYPPFDSHGNNSQQGRPRSLQVEPHPYIEENTPHQPWLPDTGELGHTYGEYETYGGSTTPIYREASSHSRQPSPPPGQQSWAERDNKFCGGFNPYLLQPR